MVVDEDSDMVRDLCSGVEGDVVDKDDNGRSLVLVLVLLLLLVVEEDSATINKISSRQAWTCFNEPSN